MNKTQESKVKRACAIIELLDGQMEIVKGTPGFHNAKITLIDLIKEAILHDHSQMITSTEFNKREREASEELKAAMLKISAAVAAYAAISDDPAAKMFILAYPTLNYEAQNHLFRSADTVYYKVQPLAALLDPFMSGGKVEELKTLADNYNTLLWQRRAQYSNRDISTKNLEDAINRMDVLLNDTIDTFVKPFEFKWPYFFKRYTNARIIVDAASRKSNGTAPKPPATNG